MNMDLRAMVSESMQQLTGGFLKHLQGIKTGKMSASVKTEMGRLSEQEVGIAYVKLDWYSYLYSLV